MPTSPPQLKMPPFFVRGLKKEAVISEKNYIIDHFSTAVENDKQRRKKIKKKFIVP